MIRERLKVAYFLDHPVEKSVFRRRTSHNRSPRTNITMNTDD